MKAHSADFTWVTFISLPLLLLSHEAPAALKQFQARVYNIMSDNTPICHDGFMSAYISKLQYADLPFTIYVQGKSDTKNILLIMTHSFQVFVLCVLVCVHIYTQMNTADITKSLRLQNSATTSWEKLKPFLS